MDILLIFRDRAQHGSHGHLERVGDWLEPSGGGGGGGGGPGGAGGHHDAALSSASSHLTLVNVQAHNLREDTKLVRQVLPSFTQFYPLARDWTRF